MLLIIVQLSNFTFVKIIFCFLFLKNDKGFEFTVDGRKQFVDSSSLHG